MAISQCYVPSVLVGMYCSASLAQQQKDNGQNGRQTELCGRQGGRQTWLQIIDPACAKTGGPRTRWSYETHRYTTVSRAIPFGMYCSASLAQQQRDNAKDDFGMMRQARGKTNVVTYKSLITACAKNGGPRRRWSYSIRCCRPGRCQP